MRSKRRHLRTEPKQFSFRRHWVDKCKPHLNNERVKTALNQGMIEFVDQRNQELAELDSTIRIGWTPQNSPVHLCNCDRCVTKIPEPGTLAWYRAHGKCHWIAPFVLELAKLMFPNDEWELVSGDYHTVVTNKKRSMVLDILLFDRYTARQSLIFAGEKPKTKLEQKFFEVIEEDNALETAIRNCPDDFCYRPLYRLRLKAFDKRDTIEKKVQEHKFSCLDYRYGQARTRTNFIKVMQ